MSNDQIKILLTIFIGGKLVSTTPRKVNKRYVGNKLLISQVDYTPPVYGECVRKVRLTAQQAIEMTSTNKDYIPAKFVSSKKRSGQWLAMSTEQRLTWHLENIADGYPYKVEFID